MPLYVFLPSVFIGLSTLYSLVRCALTEPGILPRCPSPMYLHQQNAANNTHTHPHPQPSPLRTSTSTSTHRQRMIPPAPEERDIDGLDRKWCETCCLYRPKRAKHCKFCDNCVQG